VPVGNNPDAIAVGDFNGDGNLDLAVANYASDTVSILLGNGDGTFAFQTTVATTRVGPTSVAVGDFNGDGRPDLAVSDENGYAVTILLNSSATLSITSNSSAIFTTGADGDFTITASGVPTPAISETGAVPNGVTFLDNGNGTATLAGTPAIGTGGTYVLTITASNGVSSNAIQTFTLTVDQAPALTSTNAATFITGTDGSFTITATGFPTDALSESGTLPSGITFTDNGNGTATLSGTPAMGTAGAYSLTLKAKNGNQPNAKQSFTLNAIKGQPPAITSTTAATFTTGMAGSFTVTAKGKPVPALTETGTLPSGVSFVDNGNRTAALSGTPAAGTGGTYVLALKAKNGKKPNAKQSFTLTVDEAPSITSPNTFTFATGTLSKFTITTTGFPTPSIVEKGALPDGITFINKGNGTAKLRGTPAAGSTGNYVLTLKAKNGVAPKFTESFTLVVTNTATASPANPAVSRLDTIVDGEPAVDAIILSSAGNDTLLA
jgi:FG-GAP-like repeat/Putative Ig domain